MDKQVTMKYADAYIIHTPAEIEELLTKHGYSRTGDWTWDQAGHLYKVTLPVTDIQTLAKLRIEIRSIKNLHERTTEIRSE